jgi:hypothetical protein
MYEELEEIAAATGVKPNELVVSFLRESIDRHFVARKVRQEFKKERDKSRKQTSHPRAGTPK